MEFKFKYPIIACVISALLLMSGWLGFTGLTLLVAFVPLLLLSRKYPRGRRNFWKMFGWTVLTFFIWGVTTLWWIWYATWIGPVSSIFVMMFFFGGIFMFWHWISKRVPKVLAYTILVTAWISFEYLYLNGQISFPWLNLGNGFANDVKLVQWYDTTGAFGGALWIWLSNILITEAILNRRAKAWIAPAAIIVLPVTISLIKYYSYKESGETIKVTVVQPNIDSYEEKYRLPQQVQTDNLLSLSREAPKDVDFIIMPETAIHDDVWENDIESNAILAQFRELARTEYPQTQFIIGAASRKMYGSGEKVSPTARFSRHYEIWYDNYNTAIAVDTSENVQLYHKSMLVVGVERMPYYNILRHFEYLIVDLGGTSGQLGTDSVRVVFRHPNGLGTAVPICYESIYGEYMGEFVKRGAQVLFVITNDGWWHDTPGYKQHFSFSRLRTIETRRSLARSANTGISGFINQRGDVLARSGWDERLTMTADLTLNDKITFYTKAGDYIARISVYVLGLCLLYSIAYAYRRKSRLN